MINIYTYVNIYIRIYISVIASNHEKIKQKQDEILGNIMVKFFNQKLR